MLLSAIIGWVQTERTRWYLSRQSDHVLSDMGFVRDDLRMQITARCHETKDGRVQPAPPIPAAPGLLSMLHPIAARIRKARRAPCRQATSEG